MNTCKDCEWWSAESDNEEYGNKHRDCLNDKLLPPDDAEYKLDTLLYYDEGSKFWAGPDFGCIHWEKKDE